VKNLTVGSVVTTSELAELLMLSPRRVAQLAEIGALPRSGRGRFVISEAVPAYLEFRRDSSIRRLVLEGAGRLDPSDLD